MSVCHECGGSVGDMICALCEETVVKKKERIRAYEECAKEALFYAGLCSHTHGMWALEGFADRGLREDLEKDDG